MRQNTDAGSAKQKDSISGGAVLGESGKGLQSGQRSTREREAPGEGGYRGFTLVELLVAIAILSILAATAIPAYTNYTVKSKFSEVVLATGPTKTAIATCATTGDCVSGNQIVLSGLGATVSTSSVTTVTQSSATPPAGINPTAVTPAATANASNSSQAAIWAVAYAVLLSQGYTATQAAGGATGYAGSAYTPPYVGMFVMNSGASNSCLWIPTGTSPGTCTSLTTPTSGLAQYMVAPLNPYYASYASSVATTNAAEQASWEAANTTTTTTVTSSTSYSSSQIPCIGPWGGCTAPTKYAASVGYSSSGVITATAQATSGLNAETFILMPSYSGGRVDWTQSGTCKTRQGGALC